MSGRAEPSPRRCSLRAPRVSPKLIMDQKSSDVWSSAKCIPVTCMKEGRILAKKEPPGKWKWAPCPGDGRRFSVFMCNAHKECPYRMRVAAVDGAFYIQFKGEHAAEVNARARKNSPLTFDEEAKLKLGLDQGAKPGGVLVSLTVEAKDKLQEQGLDPLQRKRTAGGLEGVR